ncbi:hypothetical protein QUF75_16255 [Desulfococcaceae bacterium HSG7]|nr:hypothetical protein [Desulfococcaceae bacterium HSG7]
MPTKICTNTNIRGGILPTLLTADLILEFLTLVAEIQSYPLPYYLILVKNIQFHNKMTVSDKVIRFQFIRFSYSTKVLKIEIRFLSDFIGNKLSGTFSAVGWAMSCMD